MGFKRKRFTHVHRKNSAKKLKKSSETYSFKPKSNPPDRLPVEKPVIAASSSSSSSSALSSEDEEEDPFVKLVMDLSKSNKKALSDDAETEEDEDSEAEDDDDDDDSGGGNDVNEESLDSEGDGLEEIDNEGEEEDNGSEEEEDGSVAADEEEEEEAGSGVADEEEEAGSVAADEEEEEEAGSVVADEEEEEEEAGSVVADEEEEEAGSVAADEEEAGSVVADEEEEEEEAGSVVADEEEEAGSIAADEEEEEEAGSVVADEEEEEEEAGSVVADEEEEAGSVAADEEEEEEAGSVVADEEEEEEEAGSVVADEEEEEAGSVAADEEEAGSVVADEEEEEEEAGSVVADEEEEAGSIAADEEEEEEAGSVVADEEEEEEEAGSVVADEEEEAGSVAADEEEEEEAGSVEADEEEEEEAGSVEADEEDEEEEEAGSVVADEEEGEAGSVEAEEEEEEAGSVEEEEEEACSVVADEEEEEGEAGSVEAEEEEGEADSVEAEEEEAGSDDEAGEEGEEDGSGAEEAVNGTGNVNSEEDDDDDDEEDVLAESDGSDDSCASENDSDCERLTNNSANPSTDDDATLSGGKDPFGVHFENLIPESSVKKLEAGDDWQKRTLQTDVGKCLHFWNDDDLKVNIPKTSDISFDDLHIKKRIHTEKLQPLITNDKEGVYSASQVELFLRMYSYQDIYYSEKNYKNQEPIEMAYCLHVLNHTLKSRLKVTSNNLKQKAGAFRDVTEEFPDQGITRPKVLIIVPFRETARRIVSNFIKILASDKSQTDNKKRFFSEYSSQENNKFLSKPEDYVATFAGNIDDHFKIGLGISQKKLQIYTKFYSSDIIIGSPLGLRSVIGETKFKKEYDFLSSIEMLILDQTDIFIMQNWEHVLYIMDHLHLQPKESHGCDFSRVRAWALNGWNKYYRQTLILSSLSSPPINVLFNKYSFNYAGKVMVCPNTTDGSICQVALQIPMIFHRIECSSYSQSVDARFNTFIKKILPKYRNDPSLFSTMIFIPSYFDFVRIRNYFIKNEISFLQINEYSKRKDISGTRSRFFLGKTNFLLYTERHHFYFRTRLRGIRHIIFYELPLYPHFFSEVCNLVNDVKLEKLPKDDTTGRILYSKYDVQRLAAVVGTNRSSLMIHSTKPVHMFVTES